MTIKRKIAVAVGCAAVIAMICFGTLGNANVDDAPASMEEPTKSEAALPKQVVPKDSVERATSSTVEPTSLEPSPGSVATPSPVPKTGGSGEQPRAGGQPPTGNSEPQNPAGGTANGTANETPPAPDSAAPAAPDSITPQPTPAPEPAPTPPTPAPEPQPSADPKPGGYAYCSCGAVLSEEEVVGHMKQHALNGENHHYDTY